MQADRTRGESGGGESNDGGGRRYNVVDLFAGCGGLSLGFSEAGFAVLGACEMEAAPAATLRLNHPGTTVVQGDITKGETKDAICRIFDGRRCHAVVGGVPCQPFSSSGRRRRDPNDPRARLYEDYIEVIRRLSPICVVMENVPLITSAKLPDGSLVMDRIVEGLADLGYTTDQTVVDAANFGVPQHRSRLILIGTHNDVPIRFPKPTHSEGGVNGLLPWRTKRDGISDLEDAPEDPEWSHVFTRHGPDVMRRIHGTPVGGSCGLGKLKDDFVRCPPDAPSKTIRTVGWPVHYRHDRVLTPREAARIQSFPDAFWFVGTKTAVAKMIGNAVPPRLARAVAFSVREMLNGAHRMGGVRHAESQR